mgnify:CR=1 FL=1
MKKNSMKKYSMTKSAIASRVRRELARTTSKFGKPLSQKRSAVYNRIAAAKNPNANKERYAARFSTGYGRGRPRIGEKRPPSENAIRAKEYRKDNEAWREYNRKAFNAWYKKNPERFKEISKASRVRRIARLKAEEA